MSRGTGVGRRVRGGRRRGAVAAGLAAAMVGFGWPAALSVLAAPPAGAATAMVASPTGAARLPVGATVGSAVTETTPLQVSVALRPSDPAGLQAMATAVSTPTSSSYHQYLSSGQVRTRFGASPATVAALRSWLTADGLTVGATTGDGLDVPASGSAVDVAAAFRTSIDHVTLADGRTAYANTTAAEVPATVRPDVAAVLGLNDLVQPHDELATTAAGATTAPKTAAGPAVPGAATPCATASATGGMTADAMASYYRFTPLYQAGKLGQGTTVALFELADYSTTDVATFEQCYGIDTAVTRVPVDGGTSLADSAEGTGEATLDIDTVASLAPDTHVLVYVGNRSYGFVGFYDTYSTMLQQNRAQVISTSWSPGSEANMMTSGINLSLLEAPVFQAMAVQGQSMLAAAGDSGSEDNVTDVGPGGVNLSNATTPYAPALSDPGSQPYVTAVGGTSLRATLATLVQQAWNSSGPTTDGSGYAAPFDGATGRHDGYPGNRVGSGGISIDWQMPPWQLGLDTSGNSSGVPCGAPPTKTGSADCREVPDVSALALFYVVYQTANGGHGWSTSGGTSAAAPLWAALLALADQGTPQGRLGLASPALYQLDRTKPSVFTDVTRGDNDYLAATSTVPAGSHGNRTCTYTGVGTQPCYEATAGYDMATGIGTPVASVLTAALDAFQVGITTTALPAATVGQPYSATLQSLGGSSPYVWAVTSGALPTGLTLDPTTGTVAGTPAAIGTSAFAVRVTAGGTPTMTNGPTTPTGPMSTATTALSITVAGPPVPPPAVRGSGYWLGASDGGIFAFGDATFDGSMGGQPLNAPIVGLAATPDANGAASGGYWEVASDGGIFAFGDATFDGSMGGQPLNAPIVGLAATPDGHGYWEVASDGGIFAFGDATFDGSMGGQHLNTLIVGLAATPDGHGYWEVASDGGIFAFGDATFDGSMGGQHLNAPIVGLAATSGAGSNGVAAGGYLEVASDGGIFAFGNAAFDGSMGGQSLNKPIVGLAAAPDGHGYWEVASDGGIFAFGDATFDGSTGGVALVRPVIGLAAAG